MQGAGGGPPDFMTTKILLIMPQPGETITEGTVVRWMVQPGEPIGEGEPIVELETEKAVFEYESPYEGKLLEILIQDGTSVPVGSPLAVFEVEDAKAEHYFMLGIGKKLESKGEKRESAIKKQEARGKKQEKKNAARDKETTLSPLLRNILREEGISLHELDEIDGTGPGGRITKENMLDYLKSRGNRPKQAPDIEVIPCSPIRIRIAERMVHSKKTIPHAHTSVTADLTSLVTYRNLMAEEFKKKHGFPLGYLPLIFPSLKKAILSHLLVNSSYSDQSGRKVIVVNKRIHMGIAVGTEKGLYTPVLRGVESKGFVDFARDLSVLVQKTRENRLAVSDLTGMTFTLNNYGAFGTTHGVQIILSPQSSTLGMGRIEKRPWVVGSSIEPRWIVEWTLAFDHRVLDGREAALFLRDLKGMLENFKPLTF